MKSKKITFLAQKSTEIRGFQELKIFYIFLLIVYYKMTVN